MSAKHDDMDSDAKSLRSLLKARGYSDQAIEAAWPQWWSAGADASRSARAELRFTMARMLGLEPRSLMGERVEFVWKDNAKFKHLSAVTEGHRSALVSFCVSAARILLRASAPQGVVDGISAAGLRAEMLSAGGHVDLGKTLAFCWIAGVPTVYLRVFPLLTKSMHAIVVRIGGRHAVFLGRDASYPAPVAFTLAHELGHVFLGHVGEASMLVDAESSSEAEDIDGEEQEADRFALELLTGTPDPDIRVNVLLFSAQQLANAVVRVGLERQIEPGTLALCVARRTDAWPQAMKALHRIYGKGQPMWQEVNALAARELDWTSLGDSDADYLRALMGLTDA